MITLTFKQPSNSIFLRSTFSLLTHIQHLTTLQLPINQFSDEHLHNLLEKCTKYHTLNAVQSFHALNIILGPYTRQPIFFYNNLINLYVGFGEICNARKVFDKMPKRNLVSYNVLISAYGRNGFVDEGWEVFCEMWGCGFRPTGFTFGGFLTGRDLDLRRGCVIHGLVVKNGLFYGDLYVGTALIGFFDRHGCVEEAIRVFEGMPRKSLVTWNSIIALLGCRGRVEEAMVLFRELMRLGCRGNGSTVVGLLSGFEGEEAAELGWQVHCLVIKSGLDYDVSTSNSLLSMCAKCADLSSVERMFEEVPLQDVVTYNTLIGALARNEKPDKIIEALSCLIFKDILPNQITYSSAINCFANLSLRVYGEYVHAKLIKNMMSTDVFVGTALIGFYGKCDMLDSSRQCFDEIYDRNLVSWNSLIAAFVSRSYSNSTALFLEMLQSGYCPNEVTFSYLLRVCSLFELQELHSLVIRMGYVSNEYVACSLISSYAKNGSVSDALLITNSMDTELSAVSSNVIAAAYNRNCQYDKSLEMLSSLDKPDTVSWNILLSTCSHNGHYSEAFDLLRHMLENQIYPDNYAIVSVLSGCTSLRSLAFGSCVHGLLIKTNFTYCDTFVCNIMIDMYAKCGSVEDSVKMFNVTANKNLITWTALISALGNHGHAHEALERFSEMELLGIKPDPVSFVAVLSACRHGGLVKEGMELFALMQRLYRLEPKMDHYHGVVDLLARHGHLKEAEQVITGMPFPPNAVIWRSFLEGCKRWKITESFYKQT